MATPPPTEGRSYTIDELASVAKVPSRTIRFYQSKGALPAPEIRGRVAYYNAAHLERLSLIAQLQDRGLRIDGIRDLVRSIERGEVDLAEWLGVEQQIQTSWAQDQPRTVSENELEEWIGRGRPGVITALSKSKLIERRGEVFYVASPALLQVALKLEAAGIDFETAQRAGEIVEKHFRRAAAELIELFLRRARDGFLQTTDPAGLFITLRPMGTEAVRVIFGHTMERGLRKLLEDGSLTKLSRKRAKK